MSTLKGKVKWFNGEKDNPSSILIKNNNLHIDILINDKKVFMKKI